MFQFVFFDLDDTLLDFHQAEAIAVAKAFRAVGLTPTEEMVARYSQVNQLHWRRLERGELTREEVLVQRFVYLFRELGVQADAALCREQYEQFLGIGHFFMEGAPEILEYLAPKYRLFLASNGTAAVQRSRLKSAGITGYFEQLFISEELGANKPTRAFFDRAFQQIPDFDPQRAIFIGDNLTSDILGGQTAGITTCWLNPDAKPRLPEIRPDYEIARLEELKQIL